MYGDSEVKVWGGNRTAYTFKMGEEVTEKLQGALYTPQPMKLLAQNLSEISSRLKSTQIPKSGAQKGRGLGHVTYFYIVGPPLYLWNV